MNSPTYRIKPLWMPVCKSNGITWHKWAANTRRMCVSLLQESNYCESDFTIIKYIPAPKARKKNLPPPTG